MKEQVNQLAIKTYGQEVMSPTPGMGNNDFPPPAAEMADTPVAAPFSDEDVPF